MRQRRSLSCCRCCCRCCFLLPKANRGIRFFPLLLLRRQSTPRGGNVASVQYPPSFLFHACNSDFVFKVVSLICPRANKLKRERSFTLLSNCKIPPIPIPKVFTRKFQTAKSKPNNTFSHAHTQKKKTKKMNHHNQSSGVQKQQRAPEE